MAGMARISGLSESKTRYDVAFLYPFVCLLKTNTLHVGTNVGPVWQVTKRTIGWRRSRDGRPGTMHQD